MPPIEQEEDKGLKWKCKLCLSIAKRVLPNYKDHYVLVKKVKIVWDEDHGERLKRAKFQVKDGKIVLKDKLYTYATKITNN